MGRGEGRVRVLERSKREIGYVEDAEDAEDGQRLGWNTFCSEVCRLGRLRRLIA